MEKQALKEIEQFIIFEEKDIDGLKQIIALCKDQIKFIDHIAYRDQYLKAMKKDQQ